MTADSAKDRLTWLLNVLPRIADDQWHAIEELERRSGPWVAGLLAYLRDVSDRADVPGGFVEGVQIFIRPDAISVQSSHFLRPLRLTPSEAAAIELGLALVEGERPPDERPAIQRLREKVRSSLTTKPTETVHGSRPKSADMHADAAAAGDPAVVALLRRAMRTRQVAEIEYQQGGSTVANPLRVHPYALVAERGKWLLWGYCETSRKRRLFRVDRVHSAKSAAAKFERPADAQQMPSKGRGYGVDGGPTVTVEYSPRIAKWIAERAHERPSGAAVGKDESVIIDHPLHDAGWAVRNVLQYGPEATVVDPPEIRDAVRATLEGLLAGRSRTTSAKRVVAKEIPKRRKRKSK